MITAVLSDIHGRLDAFLSVLHDPAFRHARRVFVLGDISGYGPDPEPCAKLWLELGRHLPCLTVAGNHELLSTGRLSRTGFAPHAVLSHDLTDGTLSPETLRAFNSLPLTLTVDNACLCHASPDDPKEYLDSPTAIRHAFAACGTRWLFAGHTHRAALYDGQRLLRPPPIGTPIPLRGEGPFHVNPGSVGLPRDGLPGSSWCLWDPEASTVTFLRTPLSRTPGNTPWT